MTTTIRYLFWDLEEETRQLCEDAILGFPKYVGDLILGCECRVVPAGRDLEKFYQESVAGAKDGADIISIFCSIIPLNECPMNIAVCCSRESRIAELMIGSNKTAQFGASGGGHAAIYHHDRNTIWHEMLHILGADDCYDKENLNDKNMHACGNPGCIMQYVPTGCNVGNPPFLCHENKEKVKRKLLSQ